MTRTTSSHSEFTRGRIRVSDYDAGELYQALALRVDQLLDTRGELIDAGLDDEGSTLSSYYNRKIAALRRAMGEIERTASEKGWAGVLEIVDQYKDEATP